MERSRSTLVLLKIDPMLLSSIAKSLIFTKHTKAKHIILGGLFDGELMGLQRREWGYQLRESGNMRMVAIRSNVKMVGADIHPDPCLWLAEGYTRRNLVMCGGCDYPVLLP